MSDTAVIVAALAALASIVAATVAAILTRRSASEANKIDAFEASLDGLGKVVEAQGRVIADQDRRIESFERELGTMKTALVEEQQQHGRTRELFRLALKHIRYMRAWLDTDRSTEPPWVPEELHQHL